MTGDVSPPRRRLLGVVALAAALTVALAPSATASSSATAAAKAAGHDRLGMNVGGLAYWENSIPFTNRFRTASAWISTDAGGSWDTGRADKLAEDADGYPTKLPQTIDGTPTWVHSMVIANTHAAGDYVLLYSGSGTIQPNVPTTSAKPGRITFHLDADEELFLTITASSASNHVRNIRVVPVSQEKTYASHPLNSQFLHTLKGMSVLRFMDWNDTMSNPARTWAQRTTPTTYSQALATGVSLEDQIDVANAVGADLWLNIPVKAGYSYVHGAAALVKKRLKPGLKVHVELGNEIWNGSFGTQQAYVESKGCAAGLNAVGDYAGSCDDGGAKYWAGLKWQAQRSAQVFATFTQVLGSRKRLVRVIASQAANSEAGRVLLASMANVKINPTAQRADVLAVAPYLSDVFTPDDQARADALTVDDVIADLRADVTGDMTSWVTADEKVAKHYGVPLVTYEAGQHAVGVYGMENDDHLTSVLTAANRDPRMRSVYAAMFAAWEKHADAGVMVLYNHIGAYSKWGSWGVLESQAQKTSTAPKYLAIQDFLAAHPG